MSFSERGIENPITVILEKHPEFAVDTSHNYEVEDTTSKNQQNFSAEPIFSKSEDKEETQGSETSLSRSISMISLVIVREKDLYGMYDSEDSEYGKYARNIFVNGDTETNLNLDKEELAYLKYYLISTAEWFPIKIWKRFKIACMMLQGFVVSVFITSLINDFGGFGLQTLFKQEIKEPITIVKNLLWKLRFLFMAVFGIYYGRKRHLEQFLANLMLTRKYWKEIRQIIIIISLIAFCGVLVFPVALEVVRMITPSENEKQFKIGTIAVNCIFSVAVRYFSLPIFFVLVHVIFLIYCQIRLFNEQVKQWPRSAKGKVRDKLIDIKLMIKDTERVFQKFLVFHMCLLLLTFIPEVFSAAERLHDESQYNSKYFTSKPRKMDLQLSKYTGFQNNSSVVYAVPLQMLDVKSLFKVKAAQRQPTEKEKYQEHVVTQTDYGSICKIIAAAVADLIEISILYSLPFILMGKIRKILKDIPETIRCLKFEEQKRNDFVFQTEEDVDTACNDFTTTQGIRVQGMQINALVAILVPLSMPLFVTVLHIMMRHVDIDP